MKASPFCGPFLFLAVVSSAAHADEQNASAGPAPKPAAAQPPVPAASKPGTAAPKAAKADAVFNIFEFRIEGNSVLAQPDIEKTVYPFLGEKRTIKDVEGARQALEKLYHDHGYLTILVNIPPQKIAEGIVRLKVVEAPIGKLRITGSQYHSPAEIKEIVPDLAEGTVPDFNKVQKELADVNRAPDRKVVPVLRASDTPGKVDVELQVKDELPLHASLDLNNHYSPNTSHLRAVADVRYDNLFQREQSIDLQYQTAPSDPRDVRVWSISYVIPAFGSAVWALYAVHSDSNVSSVGDLSVIGNGDVYGLRLIDPLPGTSERFYHSLSAGFDYKSFRQGLALQGADTVETPINYLPFSLQYSANWMQPPAQPAAGGKSSGLSSSTGLTAGISFALRGVDADPNQFDSKRFGASPSFLVFHPSLQRLQALPRDWSLFGKVEAQFASGPLISNEEFSAGGADSVRGYVESEALGDQGGRASLELRTPGLLGSLSPRIKQSYLLAFAEGAHLEVRSALPSQQSRYSLGSCGLGYRLKAGGLSVDLEAAHTLFGGPNTGSGANHGLFEVTYVF